MTIENCLEDIAAADTTTSDEVVVEKQVPAPRPSKRANGFLAAATTTTTGLSTKSNGMGNGAVPKGINTHQRRHRSKRVLPEKEFKTRESLMTRMLAMEDFAGLYNIFAAIVINLTLYTIVSDLYHHGSIHLGMSNICAMFGQPLPTWTLLIVMHFASAVPFYWTFRTWADNRASFLSMEGVWDLSFSILLVLFVYGFYYIPIQIHWAFKLPPASAAIIVLEQLRLTMKLYAFTRSNVPRVLKSCEDENHCCRNNNGGGYSKKSISFEDSLNYYYYTGTPRNHKCAASNHNDDEDLEYDKENNLIHLLPKNQRCYEKNGSVCQGAGEVKKITSALKMNTTTTESATGAAGNSWKPACAEFEHFLYFLYAPTLVYRDSYPRTKEIRWHFVAQNIVELLGCIYMYNLVHHLTGYVLIEDFALGGRQMPWNELIRFIFFQMITGGLGFILGFFILLQTTQNIAAEILRFGDREFYLDWWNSDSFGAFYRKWNLPVQDFLYTYIYKEAKEAKLDQVSRILPPILVFLISSIFHEYVLMYVLQVCYPLLLLLFGGFGMVLSFVPNTGSKQKGNLFFWWSLITGNGLIHAFYMLEYFARANGCPPAESPMKDFFIPRSWTCGAIGS